MFERTRYRQPQFFIRPWLSDVAINVAAVDGFDQRVDFGVSGENDPHHSWTQHYGFLEQLDACHIRHSLIGDQQRYVTMIQQLERFTGRSRR